MPPLDVLIVGAGLGGLAAAIAIQEGGHKATVIESAHELAEIGAGVQITPQTVRILKRWGLEESLGALAAVPKSCVLHRWSDGRVLGEEADWAGWMQRDFGAPVWDLHRADMQQALFRRAEQVGVRFRYGRRTSRDILSSDWVDERR